MSDVCGHFTLAEAAALIARRQLSAVELTRACLDRIARHDAKLGAFITLCEERALQAAARADAEIAAGRYRGALHGIPYAVKDVYDTAGIRTTGGSRAFESNVPQADAAAVGKLEQAGAVLLGKLATHELTYGGVDLTAPWQPTRNPWDPSREAGGSSTGSGAAIAAGFCLAALGTDTGGSIRVPAALCGIAGFKPSYGRVSRRGVMMNSYTLDHCGPMTWTVADGAAVLQAIAGHDPADPASLDRPVPDYAAALGRDIKGSRIGVVRHFWDSDLPAPEPVRAAMNAALGVLRDLGAELSEVTLSALGDYAEPKVVIQRPEIFSLYGADIARRPAAFGERFRARVTGGDAISAVDYLRAQARRAELTRAMEAALAGLDVLVTAGSYPAPRIDDAAAARHNRPEITVPFSMTRLPTLSICNGFTAEGLPLAMQIAGKPFDEAAVLRVADAYERATPWRARRPAL